VLLVYALPSEIQRRLTVHIPDRLSQEIKTLAENRRQSLSSLTADALAFYVHVTRRKELGQKVLDLAGKSSVDPDAEAELARMRDERHDRA
jgi:hypothetical protein